MPTLSIQLYSLRNHRDLAAQLDIARDAGFRAVETIGSMLTDAAATGDLVAERGLAVPSGHVGMPALRDNLDATIAAAKTIGIKGLVMPALHGADRPTDAAGWRAVGDELGRIAARLADHGLGFAYHNHHWEVAKLPDGTLPLDLLLDAGAPSGLKWQADLAWLVRGDDDVAARVARHGEHLHSVHVKDIAPDGEAADEDGWADVGHGRLDWPVLWALGATYADLMIAEHDKPSDPVRFARRSHAAMAAMNGEPA